MKPRVVYLALSGPVGPASRYRIHQFAGALRAKDVALDVLPAFPDAYFAADGRSRAPRLAGKALAAAAALVRRLGQLSHAGAADLVIIERESFPWVPPLIEAWLARRPAGYVLELDDAIYLARGRRWKYPAMLRQARAVIVGNETLARFARQHNPRVIVVPTVVEVARYRPKGDYGLSKPPRLGWVGLPFNFPHLVAIAPALVRAHTELGARLVIVSSREPPDLGVPFELVPWREQEEAEIIRSFDVGIMPLVDSPFARGKCGLKLLQYMAAAVPAVASPVGVNTEIIAHGTNGLLATTVDEWLGAIRSLLTEASLRERLGRAGRRTVEESYALEVWGPRLAEIYLGLASATGERCRHDLANS